MVYYISDTRTSDKNISNLLTLSGKVSIKSKYREKDFNIHRQTTGNDCWMNNIIEGDHYYEVLYIEKASYYYNKLISEYPENIWGYLRLAELICDRLPEESIRLFDKVSELVPSYYGTWFRKAQIHLAAGNLTNAKSAIGKAFELNQYEPEVVKLSAKINKI